MTLISLITIISLTLVLIRKNIYFLYLWQLKEYRFDKFLDLVRSPKFSAVFLDGFTIFRFLSFIFLIYWFQFSILTLNLILVASLLEVSLFTYQVIQKRALLPKFTVKLSVIVALTIALNSLIASALITPNLTAGSYVNYGGWNIMVFVIAITLIQLILLSPLIIGLVVFILTPIDLILKSRIAYTAKLKRLENLNLKVIGISGSYGKSSTKEILFQLLSTNYKVEKTFKNHNSTLAVARRIINLGSDVEFFLSEIGAYRKGDGYDQCMFSLPNTSIITGLNNQHYALFGGKKQIIEGESESLEFLKKGDTAIINWDSKWCHEIIVPKGIKVIKYGFSKDANLRAEIVKSSLSGTVFKVFWQDQIYNLKTNLASTGNIQNILASLACCIAHNIDLNSRAVSKTLLNLTTPEGTLQIKPLENGYLIDDSYNANLDGVLNALELLKNSKEDKVLVLDDIIELGQESVVSHLKIAESINVIKPSLVILAGKDYAKIIQDYLIDKGFGTEKIIIGDAKNLKPILKAIKNMKFKQTIYLFEGFNSRKYFQIAT
jgi:UDP-N-acetylmuramoyl-tripeptide--D-alanyl-D-alanine ligase